LKKPAAEEGHERRAGTQRGGARGATSGAPRTKNISRFKRCLRHVKRPGELCSGYLRVMRGCPFQAHTRLAGNFSYVHARRPCSSRARFIISGFPRMLTHALRPAVFLRDLHTLVYVRNLCFGHTLTVERFSFLLSTRLRLS